MSIFRKLRRSMRMLAILTLAGSFLPGGIAWGKVIQPPPPPLSQVVVPKPPELATYVKNEAAAIKLGKAFFWDMQVGSDGIQACATCHYRAGADPLTVRFKNQRNPGPNGVFNIAPGANAVLNLLDYPMFQVSPVTAALNADGTFTGGTVMRNIEDITGSQGVFSTTFLGVVPGSAVDTGLPVTDPIYNVGGVNVRQVTEYNTPSTVNAIFNYANFWDGRAHNTFNGSNPIGPLDPGAGIWLDNAGVLVKTPVAIHNAALASQATGPALSPVEMSYAGRTFPDVGRKMLSLSPLGKQLVSPADSVLGPLSNAAATPAAPGLNATYAQMIRDAFQDNLWNSTALTPGGFTQMEANFSLFWGLAVQLYESTLVSDQTPFDRFLAGDTAALSAAAQRGMTIFLKECASCHGGSELSNATVSGFAQAGNGIVLGATVNPLGINDFAWLNIGVRPTVEEIERGNLNNGFPLSFAAQALLNPPPPFALQFPLPSGATTASPLAVNGTFKIPQLRNVELTPPYFHHGSAATLEQVLEFYARGGNFFNPEMDREMKPVPEMADPANRADMIAFLTALTDDRVRGDLPPFDHPELFVPNGDPDPSPLLRIPATGGAGLTVALTPLPATPGAPVPLTTTGQGTTSLYEYRFSVKAPAGAWKVLQQWSNTADFVFPSGRTPGKHQVKVELRIPGTTAIVTSAETSVTVTGPAPKTLKISPSAASIPAAPGNAKATFSANASPAGKYEYRFLVRDPGAESWTVKRDFSTKQSWTWEVPTATPGTYTVRVDARPVDSVSDGDISATTTYSIVAKSPKAVVLKKSSSSQKSSSSPRAVTFTAAASPSGAYDYRFIVKNPAGDLSVVENGSANVLQWAPPAGEKGLYVIQVEVRPAGAPGARPTTSVVGYSVL